MIGNEEEGRAPTKYSHRGSQGPTPTEPRKSSDPVYPVRISDMKNVQYCCMESEQSCHVVACRDKWEGKKGKSQGGRRGRRRDGGEEGGRMDSF